MSDARTDPLPRTEHTEAIALLLPVGYEVRYSRSFDAQVNPQHGKSPFRGKWEGKRPPGAPDRIVVKEFRLLDDSPEEQEKVKTNRARENNAYAVIGNIPKSRGGRWLMRCYGWDTSDFRVWKAVFEEAGPNSLAYPLRLRGLELSSFVEVVLLCALDAVTELAHHGVYIRDIHPGNIMLPLGYGAHQGEPVVPDHVILGDFDHAYSTAEPVTEGFSTGMPVTTSPEALRDSLNQRFDPGKGEIDELFSIAATCHIFLAEEATVWRKGGKAILYRGQKLRPEDLLGEGYVVQPDQEALQGVNPDLQRVLNVLLLDRRAERERAIKEPNYVAALENIRARNRNRLQKRSDLERVEEPTAHVASFARNDDYSQWYIPLEASRRRAQSRRNIVWSDGPWGRLNRSARAARTWSFLPAPLITAAVTAGLTFWQGIGLLSPVAPVPELPDWPGGPWTPVQIILALAITAASLLHASWLHHRTSSSHQDRGTPIEWLRGTGVGIIGGVAVFTVLLFPRLLMAGLEQFFYDKMSYPWEHQDWLPWQWGFVADAGVFLVLLILLLPLRARTRALKRTLALAAASAIVGIGGGIAATIVNSNTTTPLGGPASCVKPLDLDTVSRRFCVPAVGTWAPYTAAASSDAMWKGLKWDVPFNSSLDKPVNEFQVALRDPDFPCLTVYVSVATVTPERRLPDVVSVPLLGEKDQVLKTVTVTRTTTDGRDRRVVAGVIHFGHYVGEIVRDGSKVSSVDVYTPYALSDGNSRGGMYGSTSVGVYAVRRECSAADENEIARRNNQLLSSMMIGDEGALDNTYFRSDPDALRLSGMKLENLFVPVDGSIRPAAKVYTPPPLGGGRKQIATAHINLSGTIAILSLVPTGDNFNWGVPDANHPGWTSFPSTFLNNNNQPETPITVFSRLFDTETGKIRVVVEFPTDPSPIDAVKNTLTRLLSRIEVRIPASDTSTTPATSK